MEGNRHLLPSPESLPSMENHRSYSNIRRISTIKKLSSVFHSSPLRFLLAFVKWPSLVRDARSIAFARSEHSDNIYIYIYEFEYERLYRIIERRNHHHLRIKRESVSFSKTGLIFSFALSIERDEKFRSRSDTRKIRRGEEIRILSNRVHRLTIRSVIYRWQRL